MFYLVEVILSAKAGLHKSRVKIIYIYIYIYIYISEFRIKSSCEKDV